MEQARQLPATEQGLLRFIAPTCRSEERRKQARRGLIIGMPPCRTIGSKYNYLPHEGCTCVICNYKIGLYMNPWNQL